MDKNYYPARQAYRKIKYAEEHNSAVYIYGATGFGKTRLLEEYLKDKKKVILSPFDEEWDLSETEDALPGENYCVVLDDMQFLRNEEQKKRILELIDKGDVWIVMAGRMQTPIWLFPQMTKGRLIIINEDDLHLSADELMVVAEKEGVKLEEELAYTLAVEGQGNAFAALSLINMLKTGNVLQEETQELIHQIFIINLEQNVIPQWDVDLQEFLMKISVVDEFTLPMAVMITGDEKASYLIEKAFSAGNFMVPEEGRYFIRAHMLAALRRRALNILGMKEYERCMDIAGLYYETQHNYAKALQLYEAAGNQDSVRRLLIRNARQHMGNGDYYSLRRYYLNLKEKDVENSPVLMSALSMLYSAMMNPEESEKWYRKLKEYAAGVSGGEKREANSLLIYLDIGLPHRGTVDLIDVLKRSAQLLKSGGLTLPEFSVTSNQPSTMNGGKDFCSWSKHDQLLANTIGPLVEKMLGSFGKGIIHAALCESFYEKGGKDDEVMQHAIMVQMAADSGGKTELLFAAVGIQVRRNIFNGNLVNAQGLLDSFEERVRKEQNTAIIPNILALRCRLALVTGDLNTAKAWMKEAPDENMEFWALERYRYMTKVRCYLAFGQNIEAIGLLERLLFYADANQRNYIRMEGNLLMAIALRREKREWQSKLLEALNEIQEYEFIRIISEMGAGILPLLKSIRKDYLAQKNADSTWFSLVLKEAQNQAERYPGYITPDVAKPEDFGETAIMILSMQSKGMTIKEIAEELGLSERTVKYHAAENYRKLGAKGKVDAI